MMRRGGSLHMQQLLSLPITAIRRSRSRVRQ